MDDDRRPGPRTPRSLLAATATAALLALAGAWSPLVTSPPPSLRAADGAFELGPADVVLQRHPEACALAVLVMLLGQAGIRADEDSLAALPGGSPASGGLTLANVAAVAAAAGLEGRWLRASVSDLETLPPPFAAELAGPGGDAPGHLVLVRRVSAAGLLIADPARGLLVWPTGEFGRRWTGRAFVAGPP